MTAGPRTVPGGTLSDRYLAGQVALVTGASRGLGRLLAEALAGAGAAVGLVARSAAHLEQLRDEIIVGGGSAVAVAADVTDSGSLAAAFEQIASTLGPIDLLVNNAGVSGPAGPLWEVDPGDWWQAMEANFRSTVTGTHLVLPSMIARKRGRIIFVTSNAGVYRWPLMSAYAVSKAAAIKLAENLAVELKRTGVTVFSAHPGLLPIGLSAPALETRTADPAWGKVHSWLRGELEQGRGAEPENAARFILRLAAGDCDSLSGCHLTVDDDLDALTAQAEAIRRGDLYLLRRRERPSEP